VLDLAQIAEGIKANLRLENIVDLGSTYFWFFARLASHLP